MSRQPDPVREGLARGWRVLGGPHGALPGRVECDVAIVGSGAGAGITAELLTQAGLRVVLVEEGPLRSSTDFHQRESEAYPTLYQESAARKTADKAINILQGRCVGGSTTVNWTSSFRTPQSTLDHWRDRFGRPPEEVDILLRCMELKLQAHRAGCGSVEIKDHKLMLQRKGEYVLIGGKFPRLREKSAPGQRLIEAVDFVRQL